MACQGSSRRKLAFAITQIAATIRRSSHCSFCSLQTVRDKCFKMCLSSPGSSLSSSDQKCLSRCMDRYQDVSAAMTLCCVEQTLHLHGIMHPTPCHVHALGQGGVPLQASACSRHGHPHA